MSLRVTVKRWTYTYDNAQRHVTAFWPISEAAHVMTMTADGQQFTVSGVEEERLSGRKHRIRIILRKSSLIRVITFPAGYHWKWVRAESRDPWVGGQKQLHFLYARPRFAYSLCNFGGSTMNIIKVICENNARPCVKKRMRFCAWAKSRDLLKVP